MEKTTIKLTTPVTSDGTEIKAVIMRKPKTRDVFISQRSTESEADKELTLIANLCELPRDAILEFDWEDYLKVQAELVRFLGIKAPDSAQPSPM